MLFDLDRFIPQERGIIIVYSKESVLHWPARSPESTITDFFGMCLFCNSQVNVNNTFEAVN